MNQNDATSRRLRVPVKSGHVDSLLRSLDALVFLQLGIVYLCDNLTFFLILRAASQVLHVQYRPPPLTPAIQLPPVVFANLLCLLTHTISPAPQSTGWASRGYIHGGLIIDFVGELGPVSKWRLVGLDLTIFALQLLILVVGTEKLKEAGHVVPQEPANTQDLEAAEEGRAGSRVEPVETQEGIELQNLLPEGSHEANAAHSEPKKPNEEDDLIELNVQEALRSLMKRSRTSATATATETAAERAGIADILTRIAAARARAG